MVGIRASSDLFYGLVHNEALGLVVHDPEAVAVDVQDGANGFSLGILQHLHGLLADLHPSRLEHLDAAQVLQMNNLMLSRI